MPSSTRGDNRLFAKKSAKERGCGSRVRCLTNVKSCPADFSVAGKPKKKKAYK